MTTTDDFVSAGLAERTRDRLQLIIDASIVTASAVTEQEIAEHLAATLVRAYRADEAAVLLLRPGGRLELAAGANPFDSFVQPLLVSDLRVIPGEVLRVSGSAEAHAVHPRIGEAFDATGVQALLVARLQHLDEEIGLLACFFRHERRFDEEAAPLATALAVQAAQAIANLRLKEILEHAAQHDTITGLPNRRFLEEHLELDAGSDLVAVLFVDLDNFKAVNDDLGHAAGDRILREVAAQLRATVRDEDVVARYGGDEFVVVCEVSHAQIAADIAERLRLAVRQPSAAGAAPIGASIGMAVARRSDPRFSVDRLIRMADQSMYAAKASGGDRVVT